MDELNLARDIVISFSVFYSGIMIVTGILRYIYLSKAGNVILGGTVFLSLYIFCHVTAKLTLFVAMFATAEPANAIKVNIGCQVEKLLLSRCLQGTVVK